MFTIEDTGKLPGPASLRTGRPHSDFALIRAVTEEERQSRGNGLTIRYGSGETPFGIAGVAWTERGICRVDFARSHETAGEEAAAAVRARTPWRNASLEEDGQEAAALVGRIFNTPFSRGPVSPAERLKLHVEATDFQLAVWRVLLGVAPGEVTTYRDLAEAAQRPRATRATGNVVARNSLAFLVPCHRVIRASGQTGGYRWGSARKRAMLAWERNRVKQPPGPPSLYSEPASRQSDS